MLSRHAGADRIVLGADYSVDEVKQAVRLPDHELAMVAAGTAARLLSIAAPSLR
jgi:hypothetical protein